MSEITKKDGMTIFKTDSRIDTSVAAKFESELLPLLTEGGMTLVLDCDDLTYMASSGLRVIQKAMRTLVHPHIQRCAEPKTKPAFRTVEMMKTNP